MKWIKKFENFTNDSNRDTTSLDYLPKWNPVINSEAAEYVDSILKSDDFHKLFKLVGMDLPKDISGDEMDKLFDEVREKSIKYFTNNPESIGKGIQYVTSTNTDNQKLSNFIDRAPKTNNVGGSLNSPSFRIGENKSNFDTEIEISEEDMNKFSTEEPLIELIRNQKIGLENKKVKFNSNDTDTIEKLDIYFEIDQKDLESDVEEE